jgi:ABC-type transport system substrate-binding protein
MKKILILLLGMVLLLTAFAGCTQNGADPGPPDDGDKEPARKVVRVGYDTDMSSMDPQRETRFWMVGLNVFDTLLKVETLGLGETELVPHLAKSWDVSDDGLVYTFQLRDDVYFHNGDKLTASDVVYTMYRLFDPADPKGNAWYASPIEGARAMRRGETDEVGVVALSEFTVEFTLEAPNAAFLAIMSTAPTSILSEAATEAAGDDFGTDPAKTIGSGPFTILNWVPNNYYSFVKNEDYWGEKPDLDEAIVKIVPEPDTLSLMFMAGEIDILDLDKATSQTKYFTENPVYKDKLVVWQRMQSIYLQLNFLEKKFQDLRVREAISLAIDRQGIINSIWQGAATPLHGVLPNGLLGFNPDLPKMEYNVARAKELLTEAGYPNGFEMTMYRTASGTNNVNAVFEILQAQLGEIGITVKIETMDNATYVAHRNTGEMEASVMPWAADFNDPDNYLGTFFAAGSHGRSINYESFNPEAAQRVVELKSVNDHGERIAGYQEVEKQIMDDWGWIPLVVPDHIWVLADNVVSYDPLWNGWADMDFTTVKMKD